MMGRFVKRFVTLSVITVSLLTLAVIPGCHGSAGLPEFTVPESFDMSRKYEITFWAKNDTNIAQTRIYSKAIDDFEALYPNITVTIKPYTDYGRIYNDVITNLATGTTPNVCITYPDHIATYLTGENAVVPLDWLFSDMKYGFGGSELRYESPQQNEVEPRFLDECVISGTHYAIPFMRSSEVCYINKTMVESLGYTLPDVLTWDFIWEVSDAAAARNDDGIYYANGQSVMIPFIYKSTDNMMIQYLKQIGAGYTDAGGSIGLFSDETKAFLYDVAQHTKTGAFSTFKISSYPGNFLNAGQSVFGIDSTAGSTWMGSDAPLMDLPREQVARFETAVMLIPQADPAAPQMISQGPSICIFNKADSMEVLASWLFAQFLLTDEIQTSYAETEGYIPVTIKARNTEQYRNYLSRAGEDNKTYYDVKIKATKLLLDNIESTFITPVWNGSMSLRDAAGQLIENVTKSVRRKETIDEAYFTKLFADVTALYRLDSLGGRGTGADENGVRSISSGSRSLGALPGTAEVLLIALISAWVIMGIWFITGKMINRRRELRNTANTKVNTDKNKH